MFTDIGRACKFGVEPECCLASSLRKEEITLTRKGKGIGAPELKSVGERAEEQRCWNHQDRRRPGDVTLGCETQDFEQIGCSV